jgi:hypothetical protein
MLTDPAALAAATPPVRKSIQVRANAARAFKVFTEGIDSWWPKTHHIGASPLVRTVLEPRVGGRIYGEQEDGSQCPWGEVLLWEPPQRFIMAWQVTPQWQFEPDLARCSEVEVTFTARQDGTTLVELEHRHFERHGEGAAAFRDQIDQPGGWGGMMLMFAAQAQTPEMELPGTDPQETETAQ